MNRAPRKKRAAVAFLTCPTFESRTLRHTWDTGVADGLIDLSEFIHHVRELIGNMEDTCGLTDDEMGGLFSSMDCDAGGTLDLDEIKNMLTRVREAAARMDDRIRQMQTASMALNKKARQDQARLVEEQEQSAQGSPATADAEVS